MVWRGTYISAYILFFCLASHQRELVVQPLCFDKSNVTGITVHLWRCLKCLSYDINLHAASFSHRGLVPINKLNLIAISLSTQNPVMLRHDVLQNQLMVKVIINGEQISWTLCQLIY